MTVAVGEAPVPILRQSPTDMLDKASASVVGTLLLSKLLIGVLPDCSIVFSCVGGREGERERERVSSPDEVVYQWNLHESFHTIRPYLAYFAPCSLQLYSALGQSCEILEVSWPDLS